MITSSAPTITPSSVTALRGGLGCIHWFEALSEPDRTSIARAGGAARALLGRRAIDPREALGGVADPMGGSTLATPTCGVGGATKAVPDPLSCEISFAS